jgi:hypothetical protein
MLYVDIPTQAVLKQLISKRADACVSIYVSTTPQTQHVGASRIAFGNLVKSALQQLDDAKFDKRRRAVLEAEFAALQADDEFWRVQANSLAVLATADDLRTFRLATAVSEFVEVADRFYIKPLLRALAFPQHAFVLALSENATRLVEIFPDLPPARVRVHDLPESASNAVGRASINDLTQNTRLANAEGQTVLLRKYARMVDTAVSTALAGRRTPLILAATQPLAPIYRATNSYPHLLEDGITTSPDHRSDHELATASRTILDQQYAREVKDARALYETRFGQDRATSDLSRTARAATFGAIEELLVDIDHVIPGTLDEADGTLAIASKPCAASYDIIDEIAGRAFVSGAKVLAVRAADIPGGEPLAATLRYSI